MAKIIVYNWPPTIIDGKEELEAWAVLHGKDDWISIEIFRAEVLNVDSEPIFSFFVEPVQEDEPGEMCLVHALDRRIPVKPLGASRFSFGSVWNARILQLMKSLRINIAHPKKNYAISGAYGELYIPVPIQIAQEAWELILSEITKAINERKPLAFSYSNGLFLVSRDDGDSICIESGNNSDWLKSKLESEHPVRWQVVETPSQIIFLISKQSSNKEDLISAMSLALDERSEELSWRKGSAPPKGTKDHFLSEVRSKLVRACRAFGIYGPVEIDKSPPDIPLGHPRGPFEEVDEIALFEAMGYAGPLGMGIGAAIQWLDEWASNYPESILD